MVVSKKLKLLNSMAIMLFCGGSAFASTTSYNLSTLIDLSPSSAFAQANCPVISGQNTCNPEGSTMGPDGNIYFTLTLPKGKIYKVTPDGQASLYATMPVASSDVNTFEGVSLRLAFDNKGNLYTVFIQKDANGAPTDNNGLWQILAGGGDCSLASGPCKKIWPAAGSTTSVPLHFGDGVAIDTNGNAYVADAQMGNIWKVSIKDGTGALWSGTDAGSTPNYLQGNPINFILGSPAAGRGLGVVGLAIDNGSNNLYATNYDAGSVIRIPINPDGTAGTQQKMLDLAGLDLQLDAIHYDPIGKTLYATVDESGFIGLVTFLGCVYGVSQDCSPFPSFVPLNDGHQILSADLHGIQSYNSSGKDVHFTPIMNDSKLGVTTGVVNGQANSKSTLYVDVYGSQDPTGSKIVKAVPSN